MPASSILSETSLRVVAVGTGHTGFIKREQNVPEMLAFLHDIGFMKNGVLSLESEFFIRYGTVSAGSNPKDLKCRLVRLHSGKESEIDSGRITEFCPHPADAKLKLIAFGGDKSVSWSFACITINSNRKLTRFGRMKPEYPYSFQPAPQFAGSTGGEVEESRHLSSVVSSVIHQMPARLPAREEKPETSEPPKPKPGVAAVKPASPAPNTKEKETPEMKAIKGPHADLINRALQLLAEALKTTAEEIRQSKKHAASKARGSIWLILCEDYQLTADEAVAFCPAAGNKASVYPAKAKIAKLVENNDPEVGPVIANARAILHKEFPIPAGGGEGAESSEPSPASGARTKKTKSGAKIRSSTAALTPALRRPQSQDLSLTGNGDGGLSPEDIVIATVLSTGGATYGSVLELARVTGISANDVFASIGRASVLLREGNPKLLALIQSAKILLDPAGKKK